MRKTSVLIMAIAGFVSGSILGITLDGGFKKPTYSIGLGLLGAVALATLQMFFIFSAHVNRKTRRGQALRRPRKRREETEGTFTDRMERFASNVNQQTKDNAPKKIPLWIAEDCGDFEPNPPKPIGIIRMLLQRIRRVLTGT